MNFTGELSQTDKFHWEKYKPAVVIILATIMVAAFLIINQYRKFGRLFPPLPPQTSTKESEGIGSDIQENVSKPVENLPQTNPFETKTNPYDDVYKNPFD